MQDNFNISSELNHLNIMNQANHDQLFGYEKEVTQN